MIRFYKKNFIYKIYLWLPIIILFISVLNEFDFNYLDIEYFSFKLSSTSIIKALFSSFSSLAK